MLEQHEIRRLVDRAGTSEAQKRTLQQELERRRRDLDFDPADLLDGEDTLSTFLWTCTLGFYVRAHAVSPVITWLYVTVKIVSLFSCSC